MREAAAQSGLGALTSRCFDCVRVWGLPIAVRQGVFEQMWSEAPRSVPGFHCAVLTNITTTVAAGELEALQECTIGLGAGDQREMLSRMVSKIAALEAAVAAAEAKRRDIHNQLVELKGNVRVWSG